MYSILSFCYYDRKMGKLFFLIVYKNRAECDDYSALYLCIGYNSYHQGPTPIPMPPP